MYEITAQIPTHSLTFKNCVLSPIKSFYEAEEINLYIFNLKNI